MGGLVFKQIKERKIWEGFNLSYEYPSYFQSWDWGAIERRRGTPVVRIGVFSLRHNDPQLVGIMQVFEVRARRGHFLHIRQGPVLEESVWRDTQKVEEIFSYLRVLAREKKCFFMRVSPLIDPQDEAVLRLLHRGFRFSPIRNVDAENRWVLKINDTQESLLSKMRKTTRYMIRKGEKVNIKIIRSKKLSDLELFLNIYKETALLKHFVPHKMIREEFEELRKKNAAFVYLAMQEREILAGAIIVYYGREAIYRHGATSGVGRTTPASYLLQWNAIKDAQRRGFTIYNFWGIVEKDDSRDSWFGLSQFKKGFGGDRMDFVHSMDLPIRKSYWITFLIDSLEKIKRNYFSTPSI